MLKFVIELCDLFLFLLHYRHVDYVELEDFFGVIISLFKGRG